MSLGRVGISPAQYSTPANSRRRQCLPVQLPSMPFAFLVSSRKPIIAVAAPENITEKKMLSAHAQV